MPKTKHQPPRIEQWPINKPIPYARNPRKIDDSAVGAVAGSIAEFGFKSPIIVDVDGVIINGHTRLMAARRLGLDEVPVIVAADLTPEQVRAYRLADNRVAEFSAWDADMLRVELDDIGDVDLDFADFGALLANMDDQDAADQMNDGDPDDVPAEAAGEPVSQRGEVYELGPHRLMCGDSTSAEDYNALTGGSKCDVLLSDPPYGMHLDTDYSKMPRGVNVYENVIGDDKPFDIAPIISLWGHRSAALWGGGWFYNGLPPGGSWVIWDKMPAHCVAGPQNHFEECWVYPKKKRVMIRHLWTGYTAKEKGEKRVHPTQKPVKVMTDLIDILGAFTTCDEPFGGSGTTLIAAAKTGRICRAMEISPRYCDVIRRRWTKFARENGVEPGSGGLD
jgi:hypothetical protein